MPLELAHFLPGGQVPKAEIPLGARLPIEQVAAAGDRLLAVGGEGDGPDAAAFLGFDNPQFLARIDLPQPRGAIAGTGERLLAVRGIGDVPKGVVVPLKSTKHLAGFQIPQIHTAIGTACKRPLAVRG